MLNTVSDQKARDLFRLFDGNRTHKNGLSLFVPLCDFAHDRLLLSLGSSINEIGQVLSLHRLVRRDFHNVQGIDRAELTLFRLGGTRHTGEFAIKAEIVLEGNGSVGLVLLAHLYSFLRLDRLMQSVRIAAPDHETTRKFVYNDDFAVLDDILIVEFKQVVRFQRLLNVMVQTLMRNIGNIVNVEESFRLLRAVLGKLHLLVLTFDDVVPFEFLRLLDLLRARVLFLFALLCFGVLQIIVKAALQGAHEAVYPFVKIGRLFAFSRNNQRRSCLVDQNRVHLVDDRKVKFALNH